MPRPWTRAVALALSVALGALALPASVALASVPRLAVAPAAALPSGDTVVATPIRTAFDVVLAQRDPAALTAFIASLSDTASPNYHRYLTPTEFARRFGATSQTEAAVRSYLEGYGLQVGAVNVSGLVVHVTGSTRDVASAFATSVATVRGRRGTLAAQFTHEASLPAPIAHDVAAIYGLSTLRPYVAALSARTTTVATAGSCSAAGSNTSNTRNSLGYTIPQEAQLYGLAAQWALGNTGVGQTIAIYELGDYNPSDIAVYFACYGINPTVKAINVDGGAPGAFSEEADLDVEEAGALAPGANIEVYQGPNNGTGPLDVYSQIADDDTATVTSTSWGDCEVDPSGDPAAEQLFFEQMAAQGEAMVSAAGDNGSSDCAGITNDDPAVDDPASQPYVTGVGALTVSQISPLQERVWNDGVGSGGGASGGGMSAIWSRPTWQNAPGILPSDTQRMVPDLSVIGDPSTGFIEYFTGAGVGTCTNNCNGWEAIGGTSVGAPLVSALIATAAQYCSVPRLGFVDPTLYTNAATAFNAVTQGSNDLYGVGVYSAGPGYTMAAGLGSPNPATFIQSLCPAALDTATSSLVPEATSTGVNDVGAATLTLLNTEGLPILNGTVALSASAASGTIVIDEDSTSSTGPGKAAYDVTTDLAGINEIDLTTTAPGPVTLTATYENQPFTTTIDFTKNPKLVTPGTPAIASLVALVGGFRLTVRAPASNGGSRITAYQYSLDGGITWVTFSAATRTATNTRLARGKRYRIQVRAVNANGESAINASATVKTKA